MAAEVRWRHGGRTDADRAHGGTDAAVLSGRRGNSRASLLAGMDGHVGSLYASIDFSSFLLLFRDIMAILIIIGRSLHYFLSKPAIIKAVSNTTFVVFLQ